MRSGRGFKLFLKSMFAKLMASFILIILIISVFYIYSYKEFTKIVEDQIAQNIDERFDNLVTRFDRYFDQIKYILLQMSFEKSVIPATQGSILSMYEQRAIIESFKERVYENNQNEYLNDVRAIFILSGNRSEYIVESHGTFERKSFFNMFYKSTVYTDEFWMNEMKRDFTFNIYPSTVYKDSSILGSESYLMPIAFKIKNNNNYIMIALVDIKQATFKIEGVSDSIFIYNQFDQCLYPLESSLNVSNTHFGGSKRFQKTEDGYLFMRTSDSSSLKYYKLISDAKLKEEMHRVITIFQIVLAVSILVSIAISLMIVTKFNNPIKQISEIIQKSKNSFSEGSNAFDLVQIRDHLQQLINLNENYKLDISSKNSLLRNFFYQAKIQDVYFNFNDIKDLFTISRRYALVYFQIHYRDNFYQKLSEEKNKVSFVIKELIDMYVNSVFPGSITFQAENSKIISVINIDKGKNELGSAMEEISLKLQAEDEFIFFTLIISEVYDDVSQIQKVYTKLYDISKCRKPLDETQLITEKIIAGYPKRFFLSNEHTNLLPKLLSNGLKEDCIKLVDDILSFNYKKGVTCLYMALLCDEIIKCCVNELQKLQQEVPDTFDITGIHDKLHKSTTLQEFKQICCDVIAKCMECITSSKKDDDYIIDFILKYIDEHYNRDIYLDIFSERLGITSAYISTYFKSKMSINLIDYINSYKIKKAVELIDDPKLKIKDIALMVGIANINTFTRLFKKYEGYTPNEYRKHRQDFLSEPIR